MKRFKISKLSLVLPVLGSVFLGSNAFGSFDMLDRDVYSLVCKHLLPESLNALEQVSRSNRTKVQNLKKQYATLLVKESTAVNPELSGDQMNWLFARLQDKVPSPQLSAALNTVEEKLKEEGFVCIAPTSPLAEQLMGEFNTRTNGYKDLFDEDRITPLFESLFVQKLEPRRKGIATGSLRAVLPVIRYREQQPDQATLEILASRLRTEFSAMREKQPYFPFGFPGVDASVLKDRPHRIVVNQGSFFLQRDELNAIFPENNPHTLVLNILVPGENGVLSLRAEQLPDHVSHLVIRDLSNVVRDLGTSFLYGHMGLKSVDLSGLGAVVHIGDDCVADCKNLTEIDISGFRHVKTLGKRFLGGCEKIKFLNTSSFYNVNTINSFYLSGCKSLEEISLADFRNVESIGAFFLRDLENLRGLDIPPLRKLKSMAMLCFQKTDKTPAPIKTRLAKLKEDTDKRSKN